MWPRIDLGFVQVPTYGLMVALGFVAGLFFVERLARAKGFPKGLVADTLVWGALIGLAGAKLGLIALEWEMFISDPVEVLFQGGVFYFGFFAAFATMLVRCAMLGISPSAVADVAAAPLALAHAFGRVGCFLSGCCWGTACEAPWGVVYTHPLSIPVLTGLDPGGPLHPVQLYEAGGNLVLAAIATWLVLRRSFVGQAAWTHFVLYGLFRFGIEELRGDPRGAWLDGRLSTSQIASIVAVAIGLVMLWLARRKGLAWRKRSPMVLAA